MIFSYTTKHTKKRDNITLLLVGIITAIGVGGMIVAGLR